MNKNISTLDNVALDWAFAAAIGMEIYFKEDLDALGEKESKKLGKAKPVIMVAGLDELSIVTADGKRLWNPTRDWSQASVIWNRRGVSISYMTKAQSDRRTSTTVGEGSYEVKLGHTVVRSNAPLKALCRAVVIDKFGGQMDVPVEFL